MKAMSSPQKASGFTMIEVLGVIAALATISAIGYVAVTRAKQSADATKLEQDVESLNRSIQIYLSSGGSTNGMTGADDGAPNYCDVLTILKTSGAEDTIGIRSSVIDRRVYADRTNGGNTTRLRATWSPSTNSAVPPRFVIGMSSSGIVEFPINEAISANASLTSNRTGAANVGTDGWAWQRGTDAEIPPVRVAYDPGTNPGNSQSEDDAISQGWTGGPLIVTGPVHTDNKYYDGAGYRGELGLFSLEGMGNPPYDVKTPAGLLAFMREAVRRVAERDKGGVAMDRDGRGKDLTFPPGTAVAFILIPNNTFTAADTFIDGNNPSTSDTRYPLTSLSFDTDVPGFATSQAVSLGHDAYTIEDMAGGGDRDYEDIVWKTTGVSQAGWAPMEQVDAATYYSEAKLNSTGDTLLNGTDPTLRQAFQNLGVLP